MAAIVLLSSSTMVKNGKVAAERLLGPHGAIYTKAVIFVQVLYAQSMGGSIGIIAVLQIKLHLFSQGMVVTVNQNGSSMVSITKVA